MAAKSQLHMPYAKKDTCHPGLPRQATGQIFSVPDPTRRKFIITAIHAENEKGKELIWYTEENWNLHRNGHLEIMKFPCFTHTGERYISRVT
ncbi:hypothetical protein Pfo_000660, partial [Paulownia fortunei]